MGSVRPTLRVLGVKPSSKDLYQVVRPTKSNNSIDDHVFNVYLNEVFIVNERTRYIPVYHTK